MPKVKNAHQFIDLICNMSGNAFSAFHCIPMFLTTLATMGRFSVLECEEVVVDTDDDEQCKDLDATVLDSSDTSD